MKALLLATIAICICSVALAEENEKVRPSEPLITPDIYVSGVMVGGERPFAIINDEIIEEGDVVEGVKILGIGSSGVICEYGGEIFNRRTGERGRHILREASPRGGKDEAPSQVPQEEPYNPLEIEAEEITYIPALPTEMQFEEKVLRKLKAIPIVVLLLIFLAIYSYVAICIQTIAKKTNTEYAWVAWVPLFSFFLILRIAGKPFWWFFLLSIPIVNLLLILLVWIGIAKARGKSPVLGMLMFVPLVNFFILPYLAFSE